MLFFGGFGGCVLLVCGFGFLLCCVWVFAGWLAVCWLDFGFPAVDCGLGIAVVSCSGLGCFWLCAFRDFGSVLQFVGVASLPIWWCG